MSLGSKKGEGGLEAAMALLFIIIGITIIVNITTSTGEFAELMRDNEVILNETQAQDLVDQNAANIRAYDWGFIAFILAYWLGSLIWISRYGRSLFLSMIFFFVSIFLIFAAAMMSEQWQEMTAFRPEIAVNFPLWDWAMTYYAIIMTIVAFSQILVGFMNRGDDL